VHSLIEILWGIKVKVKMVFKKGKQVGPKNGEERGNEEKAIARKTRLVGSHSHSLMFKFFPF